MGLVTETVTLIILFVAQFALISAVHGRLWKKLQRRKRKAAFVRYRLVQVYLAGGDDWFALLWRSSVFAQYYVLRC